MLIPILKHDSMLEKQDPGPATPQCYLHGEQDGFPLPRQNSQGCKADDQPLPEPHTVIRNHPGLTFCTTGNTRKEIIFDIQK